MRIILAIKHFLKNFLPPSVRAFNREVDRILAAVKAQQKNTATRKQQEQLAVMLQDIQNMQNQQAEILQIPQTLQEIQEHLIRQEAMLKSAIQQQTELVTELGCKLEKNFQQAELQDSKLYSAVKANKKALGGISQLHKQVQTLEAGMLRNLPQPRLDYFVLNILDHCNLRCKGCDHFAAIAEKRFVALENICRDLERMSQLTCQRVTRIGVMGGEPLLHPQLKEILSATRYWFSQTLIQVVSNGLLLLQQDDAFWKTCRDNNITIVVTKYPINLDFERMEQTARDWGVSFEYYGKTGEVTKTSYKMPMDIDGQQNPVKSFWNCYHGNHCPLLMEGKFYPCTVVPNVCHFNKKFGTAMELEQGDWLDIYQVSDVSEIYRFLCTPKPFCRYCRTMERSFGHPWERSKQQAEEWI